MQALQIGEIAGSMERKDLTPAFRKKFVSADETSEDEAALTGSFPLNSNVFSIRQSPDLHRQFIDRGFLVRGHISDAFELPHEPFPLRSRRRGCASHWPTPVRVRCCFG